jgi:hypothetical protein
MNTKGILQSYSDVKIPDSDIVITLKHNLPWYDQMELSSIKDDIERAKFLIWKMIYKWNLVDDNGEAVPITKEVVDEFGAGIVFPLQAELEKIAGEQNQKKKI